MLGKGFKPVAVFEQGTPEACSIPDLFAIQWRGSPEAPTMAGDTSPELAKLLLCLHQTPDDGVLWLAVADCLEEQGEAERAELLRLTHRLCDMDQASGPREGAESRIRELLNGGVRPCVPEIVNSIGMRFVLVPAGSFWMGSPEDEAGHSDEEGPRHRVEITRPFWMGVFLVTQGQYEQVMGKNPAYFSTNGGGKDSVKRMDTSSFPVEKVSWDEAVEFCGRLTERSGESGRSYRLPTEAEWEHACRGGLFSKPFHFGDELNGTQANCDGNFRYGTDEKGPYLDRTCAVGSYPPNAFGLHDMHGNVWEWCQDWFDETAYSKRDPNNPNDPQGPPNGESRVLRGGAWCSTARGCRAAFRYQSAPGVRNSSFGFRVCFRLD